MMLGVSMTTAYRLARLDEFPVPVRRVGNQFRVPAGPLNKLLSIDNADVVVPISRGPEPSPTPSQGGEKFPGQSTPIKPPLAR